MTIDIAVSHWRHLKYVYTHIKLCRKQKSKIQKSFCCARLSSFTCSLFFSCNVSVKRPSSVIIYTGGNVHLLTETSQQQWKEESWAFFVCCRPMAWRPPPVHPSFWEGWGFYFGGGFWNSSCHRKPSLRYWMFFLLQNYRYLAHLLITIVRPNAGKSNAQMQKRHLKCYG